MGKKGKIHKYQGSSKTENVDDTEKEGWSDRWIALTIVIGKFNIHFHSLILQHCIS